jgi:hypothetical protein
MDSWRDGIPDGALAAAAGRIGLTLAEAEALQMGGPLRRLARMLHGFTTGFSWVTGVPFRRPLGSAMVHGVLDLHLSGAPGDAAVCLVPGRHGGSPAGLSVILAELRSRGGEGRQVRAAFFGIDQEGEKLRWASDPPVAPAEIEAQLRSAVGLGPALVDGLEQRGCEALGCGFVRRCHPPERGL